MQVSCALLGCGCVYVAICMWYGRICLIVLKCVSRTLNQDGAVVTITPDDLEKTAARAMEFYQTKITEHELEAIKSYMYDSNDEE